MRNQQYYNTYSYQQSHQYPNGHHSGHHHTLNSNRHQSNAGDKPPNRLDALSSFGTNYPEDYLPYATTRRNKTATATATTALPYIVWDSCPVEEYQAAASVHSHPASLVTLNHIAAHSCHSIPASSSSWSSYRSRRCCSLGCCAIVFIASFVVLALLTVIGISVYLGVITNLHKSTLLPVSGRFKVDSGDDFNDKLYNSSSLEFLAKASKYEAVLVSAFKGSAIEESIVKSEVYAFRKGSLIVFFRIYLDRRKIGYDYESLSMKSGNLVETEESPKERKWVPNFVQHYLREGISHLRIIGSQRVVIDVPSVFVSFQYSDSLLDPNSTLSEEFKVDHISDRSDEGEVVIVTSLSASSQSTTHRMTSKPNYGTLRTRRPTTSYRLSATRKTISLSTPISTSRTTTKPTRSTTTTKTTTTTTTTTRPTYRATAFITRVTPASPRTPRTPIGPTLVAMFAGPTQKPSVPSNHKQPPETSVRFTQLDFGQWRPVTHSNPSDTPLVPMLAPQLPPPPPPRYQRPVAPIHNPPPHLYQPHRPQPPMFPPHPHRPQPGHGVFVPPNRPFRAPVMVGGRPLHESPRLLDDEAVPGNNKQPLSSTRSEADSSESTESGDKKQEKEKLMGGYQSNSSHYEGNAPQMDGLERTTTMVLTTENLINWSPTASPASPGSPGSPTTSPSTTIKPFDHLSGEGIADGFIVPVINNHKAGAGGDPTSFRIRIINNTSSFFRPYREMRKNSFAKETPSSSSATSSPSAASSSPSPGEVRLLSLPDQDVTLENPIIAINRKNKSHAFISDPIRDLPVESPVIEWRRPSPAPAQPSSSTTQFAVESPVLFLRRNRTRPSVTTTSTTTVNMPLVSDYSIDVSFSIRNRNRTGSDSSTHSFTRKPNSLFIRDPVFVPFDSSRLASATVSVSTPSSFPSSSSVMPNLRTLVRMGLMNKEFRENTSLSVSSPSSGSLSLHQSYGERLPKYIPPSLLPQTPQSNEISEGKPLPGLDLDAFAFDNVTDSPAMELNAGTTFSLISTPTETVFRTSISFTTSCQSNEFHCKSGQCIPISGQCNRRADCKDGSDEASCSCVDFLRLNRHHRKICDGVVDCWDHSDEANCVWCQIPDGYICSGSKACINQSQVCDGSFDCPNGSDEESCVALVDEESINMYQSQPSSAIKVYNKEGILLLRERGKWAPICLENLNAQNDVRIDGSRGNDGEKLKAEDLGKAICSAQSFRSTLSVQVRHLTGGPNVDWSKTTFYHLDDPEKGLKSSRSWSLLFRPGECLSRRTAYVKCSGFECGVRPTTNTIRRRIIGGNSARPGSWPWQVALYREGEFQCGGVLINDQWLLSAAHCFHSTREAYWTARLGVLRRGNQFPNPEEQLRRISHVIVHPDYVDKGFINDLVLLRMEKPINFSDFVRPVCLPPPGEDVHKWHDRLCTTVGWGKLFEVGRIFRKYIFGADTLQEVRLPVISTEECRKRTIFLPLYKITDNMFCAGYTRGGRDACLGDSGGPLMCQMTDGRWSLLGVTSNGDGCGRAGRPGVYTKVANYINWVEKTINETESKEVLPNCSGIRCPLGKCLKPESVCNGLLECRDASDERNCTYT